MLMSAGLGFLALRLAVAVIFVVHALPKLQKPAGMAAGMKWPTWKVQLVGAAELLGGLAVATGFGLYIGAAVLALVMVGAMYYKIHVWKAPFTAMDKMGWEFDLILLAATLFIWSTGM